MRKNDPLWYKDAVIYQLHVKAYADADADGIGDFRGLTQKLDYLQDLGVTAVWLLPFYPSPLKDDGYDTADYTTIHTNYGSLRDFKNFLREAHRRNLKVITELVLNHTSDQHPWFKKARAAEPGSYWHEFYVWSNTPERYKDARIIFQDFELSNWSWDPVAQMYYWHRFYHHQPDLNFENPNVGNALLEVVDQWLGMGVDGLRLDAVPYLFEREGTNCENLPETHAFLKKLRAHIDAKFPGRMLLAEANQWPEDAVAYFGDGDECNTAFHFPVMPRMFMAVQMEDRFPIIDILEQTPDIPDNCQWVLFLRNHDELTLEMVTDEERDYMYRSYARQQRARINLGIRRRLAPLLGNDRRKIELLNGLLLSLPGTPVIYYGDELGMGDNIFLGDRNGVRTPMQWSADRNAGFSRANPQQLYLPVIIDHEYHYEAVNAEAQRNNPSSLLRWTKRILATRQQHRAFGRGTIEFLYPENPKVVAYIRRYEDECILVVANLSRFAQYVELDLNEFHGSLPIELFSRAEFPRIGELPYLLTLGPHAFYWFLLRGSTESLVHQPQAHVPTAAEPPLPSLEVTGNWERLFDDPRRRDLERLLPRFLLARKWFGIRPTRIQSVNVVETISLKEMLPAPRVCVLIVRVEFAEGEPEIYVLPLGFSTGEWAERMLSDRGRPLLTRLRVERGEASEDGVVYDAFGEERVARALLELIVGRRRFSGSEGRLVGTSAKHLKKLLTKEGEQATAVYSEHSDRTVMFGDQVVLKLIRRIDEGDNPDLEVGRFLTEQAHFAHAPSVVGALEYHRNSDEPRTLAILKDFERNEGDAWSYTLDSLGRFFEAATSLSPDVDAAEVSLPAEPLLDWVDREIPALAHQMLNSYLDSIDLLGRRTAELHQALASNATDPKFVPEPFTQLYQRSLYQGLRSHVGRTFRRLRQKQASLPEAYAADVQELLDRQEQLIERFSRLLGSKISAARIRCHGNFHLGRVLFTGKDFFFIDFEGQPGRPISERRIKRSPLRDVASLLCSLDYARHVALASDIEGTHASPEEKLRLDRWGRLWLNWASAAFLRSYLEAAGETSLLPKQRDNLQLLLDLHRLEKLLGELNDEITVNSEFIGVRVESILGLLPIGTA